jgi:hypothetical protein
MLDPATQRRFTMRVAFRALDADRTAQQFRRWFGSGIPPGFHLTNTTPGDFAVVAKRAQLLGECDPRQLARWLWEEAEARGEMRAAIGFVA